MPEFTVIDAKDAPLAPGMRCVEMPDGTYRVLMPGAQVERWVPGGGQG